MNVRFYVESVCELFAAGKFRLIFQPAHVLLFGSCFLLFWVSRLICFLCFCSAAFVCPFFELSPRWIIHRWPGKVFTQCWRDEETTCAWISSSLAREGDGSATSKANFIHFVRVGRKAQCVEDFRWCWWSLAWCLRSQTWPSLLHWLITQTKYIANAFLFKTVCSNKQYVVLLFYACPVIWSCGVVS